MNYKIGDRVRNIGHGYSDHAKDGTVVEITSNYIRVKFDSYKTLLCDDSVIELIKEGTMETKKLYKVVHDDGNGRYSSVYAGQPCDFNYGIGTKRMKLNYQIGQITIAAQDSDGIYCHEDLEKARRHAEGEAGLTVECPTAILEVEAVTLVEQAKEYSADRPAAVQVIGEVWREEPPKFKAGDSVRFKAEVTKPSNCVPPNLLGKLGIYQGVSPAANADVKFESGRNVYHCKFDELELAPKEEWVDITQECTVELMKNMGTALWYILIAHDCHQIIRMGDKVVVVKDRNYKVELLMDTEFHYSCGGFKVLKKVVR